MSVPFIIDKAISYSDVFTTSADPLLQIILDETRAAHPKAHMLSGEVQGQFLSILSCIKCPMHILEIGTFTGYAALCLCEGMQENGQLHTIDIKEELETIQRKYFDKSPWGSQIFQHLGEAIDIIPTLEIKFDLVFIDADKENYLNYFEMILPKMNKGGIILSDNVLWSGKVLEPLQKNDISTKVLLEYNELLKNDPRIETVLLPIRDGLTVSRVR